MATRITLATVRSLPRNAIVWDAAVTGFYARRQQSEAVRFGLFYRTEAGRQRFLTIGRFGAPWTPDEARAEARRLLGEVAKGQDPSAEKEAMRHAVTVAELCVRYLADAEAGRVLVRGGRAKKPLTLASDRGRIEGHIMPLLGALPVGAVTRQDVERFMHQVAEGETARSHKVGPRAVSNVTGGRGVATRTIGLLGAIFSYAVEHRMRTDNPAHGIRKFAENKRERRLSGAEYPMLGKALRQAVAAGMWPPAIACARFLALTGWRSGEALALRWQDIYLARRTATLPDTKTGRSMRPLSYAACELL
ncbi:MAG: tyrosine-type recombinase/integrase, partial [Acetobacteraceae bacterium]